MVLLLRMMFYAVFVADSSNKVSRLDGLLILGGRCRSCSSDPVLNHGQYSFLIFTLGITVKEVSVMKPAFQRSTQPGLSEVDDNVISKKEVDDG